jgi:hypothetical protein
MEEVNTITPKEKALKFYNDFFEITQYDKKQSKECALISVDLATYDIYNNFIDTDKYWKEVKKVIEKL